MSKEANKASEKDLLKLLNDIDFERIDLGLQATNIFDVLGATRAELRHSNFLGWLLEPHGTHGLDRLVLNRFLRDVFSSPIISQFNAIDADLLDYSQVEVRREWQHIDLLVLIGNVAICIENKVDYKEHSNQLKRYRAIIEEEFDKHHHVFVYLTPQGDTPKQEAEVYIPYSYGDFAQHLERILQLHGHTLNQKSQIYINDYLMVLKRDITQKDELNEMAVKLYKTHKTALDFIFENKPDIEQEVRALIQQKVKDSGWVLGSNNKGFVRFLTPALDALIPRYDFANGWPNKEAFLFEIDFFWYKRSQFVFKTTISPGKGHVPAILKSAIDSVPGASKPSGEQWISHFIEKRKFLIDEMNNKTEEERQEKIDSFWPMFTDIVTKVEQAILSNITEEDMDPYKGGI